MSLDQRDPDPMSPRRSLTDLLEGALAARAGLFDGNHQTGFRLFNGFSEGEPALAVDLYARTALVHNYADDPAEGQDAVRAAQEFLQARLPWLRCALVKTRNGRSAPEKQGRLL